MCDLFNDTIAALISSGVSVTLRDQTNSSSRLQAVRLWTKPGVIWTNRHPVRKHRVCVRVCADCSLKTLLCREFFKGPPHGFSLLLSGLIFFKLVTCDTQSPAFFQKFSRATSQMLWCNKPSGMSGKGFCTTVLSFFWFNLDNGNWAVTLELEINDGFYRNNCNDLVQPLMLLDVKGTDNDKCLWLVGEIHIFHKNE